VDTAAKAQVAGLLPDINGWHQQWRTTADSD
jgi:hypothetical protein